MGGGSLSFLTGKGLAGTPPIIANQTQSSSIWDGHQATLFVTLDSNSTRPFNYTWQRSDDNGVTWTNVLVTNNSNSLSNTYTFTPNYATDPTPQFQCQITNGSGSITSALIIATIFPGPSINSQTPPAGVFATGIGDTVNFSVQASGAQLTYDWQFSTDGTNWTDTGASSSVTYSTGPVGSADSGKMFQCVVTNPAGSATSGPVTLQVYTTPVITSGPTPLTQTVQSGQTTSIAITASGEGPLSYQWQENSAGTWFNIPGANSATLTFQPGYPLDNGALFQCVVSNPGSSATSSTATMTVTPSPAATLMITPGQGVLGSNNNNFYVVESLRLLYIPNGSIAPNLPYPAFVESTATWTNTPGVFSAVNPDNNTFYPTNAQGTVSTITGSYAGLNAAATIKGTGVPEW